MENYKYYTERMKEEKEYFENLLHKLKSELSERDFHDLKSYLKTYNKLTEAREEIVNCDNDIFHQLNKIKQDIIDKIHEMIGGNICDDDEIESIIYVFNEYIIAEKMEL